MVSFGVVASKNAVSPFAAERGRVRKRFKAAVEEVVNNGTEMVKDFRRGTYSFREVRGEKLICRLVLSCCA